MKSAMWGLAGILCLGTQAALAAEPGPYIAGNLGFASIMDRETDVDDPFFGNIDVEASFDNALFLSAAGGYAFGGGPRVEFEISRIGIKGDKLKAKAGGITDTASLSDLEGHAILLTVGGYYDFQTSTVAAPYVGAGIGAAIVDVDDYEVAGVEIEGDTETDLAAFGEFGVNIAASDSLSIVPAYRFVWINNGEAGWDDTKAHVFKIGARYKF